ncbi:MAG: transcriptional repressor [Candidatus Pacebacteria bacterium]|nr:transcriptional repressor [Candidatus Paceibacterota bacterium]
MDKMQDILKKTGMKVTKNRLAVLDLLITSAKPMSVEDIFKKLKKADQVTIYRILNQFVLKDVVYQTDFRSGKAYFEFQDHHHHHIVCKGCGCLEEVDICLPESFVKKVASQSNKFKNISDHALEFFGVCGKCDRIKL